MYVRSCVLFLCEYAYRKHGIGTYISTFLQCHRCCRTTGTKSHTYYSDIVLESRQPNEIV